MEGNKLIVFISYLSFSYLIKKLTRKLSSGPRFHKSRHEFRNSSVLLHIQFTFEQWTFLHLDEFSAECQNQIGLWSFPSGNPSCLSCRIVLWNHYLLWLLNKYLYTNRYFFEKILEKNPETKFRAPFTKTPWCSLILPCLRIRSQNLVMEWYFRLTINLRFLIFRL